MPDPSPPHSTFPSLASFCPHLPCLLVSNISLAHPFTGSTVKPCPPGTYGQVPGLSSLTGCQACYGGKLCPWANATEAGRQCWEGFFCSRG